MKRIISLLLLLALLFMPVIPAQAGWNEVSVATDGKGIAVYSSSNGGKQVGVLYNGFTGGLSLEAANGLYSCDLTFDYTVWLNQDKAEKNQPRQDASGIWNGEAWRAGMPSNLFVAEVTHADAPLYTTPGHKHITAKHAPGTLLVVMGEFGDDYYVGGSGYIGLAGFMPKSALKKVRDLTFAANWNDAWKEAESREVTVYTGGTPLAIPASATGYCDMAPLVVRDGSTARVLRELGDWSQLADGYFIETRFLRPDGDHSVTYATVKTDSVTNRLNVRGGPSTDDWVVIKLCSGTKVQVPSHTDSWASVYVTGPQGGASYSGSAQMQYLAFGAEGEKVKSGCVRVRLKDTYYIVDDYFQTKNAHYADKAASLPAGTEMTVIGVGSGYDVDNDDADKFFCILDNGQAVAIWNDNGGILEPMERLGVYAKAASSVKMRESPSKNAKSIRTLDKGTKVEVLLRGEGWTMVEYKGKTGYVMSRYLSFP